MQTFVLDCTCSLHSRHFFTLGEHREHVAMWPHGPNKVSLFKSEHTIHSSNASCSLRIRATFDAAPGLERKRKYCKSLKISNTLNIALTEPRQANLCLRAFRHDILTAHAQPFRGARDLAFCLKVPLDSLLVWASRKGSGETARMCRLAWTFAACIGDKYQIRLTRPN